MTGTYHDFGSFISYVANFPFIVNVSGVSVEATTLAVPKKESDSGEKRGFSEFNKPETVKANFILSTYYVKDSERLQEIEI